MGGRVRALFGKPVGWRVPNSAVGRPIRERDSEVSETPGLVCCCGDRAFAVGVPSRLFGRSAAWQPLLTTISRVDHSSGQSCRFQYCGFDTNGSPGCVRDAVAGTVGVGNSDERGFECGQVDDVSHRIELGPEIVKCPGFDAVRVMGFLPRGRGLVDGTSRSRARLVGCRRSRSGGGGGCTSRSIR
jgi:hypothetical protein